MCAGENRFDETPVAFEAMWWSKARFSGIVRNLADMGVDGRKNMAMLATTMLNEPMVRNMMPGMGMSQLVWYVLDSGWQVGSQVRLTPGVQGRAMHILEPKRDQPSYCSRQAGRAMYISEAESLLVPAIKSTKDERHSWADASIEETQQDATCQQAIIALDTGNGSRDLWWR